MIFIFDFFASYKASMANCRNQILNYLVLKASFLTVLMLPGATAVRRSNSWNPLYQTQTLDSVYRHFNPRPHSPDQGSGQHNLQYPSPDQDQRHHNPQYPSPDQGSGQRNPQYYSQDQISGRNYHQLQVSELHRYHQPQANQFNMKQLQSQKESLLHNESQEENNLYSEQNYPQVQSKSMAEVQTIPKIEKMSSVLTAKEKGIIKVFGVLLDEQSSYYNDLKLKRSQKFQKYYLEQL